MSWVLDYKSRLGDVETSHWNGVDWMDAPLPRRLHRCQPQTRGYMRYFTLIERCACGAFRENNGRWIRRNERRRGA